MKHRLEYTLALIVSGLMRLFPRRSRLACGRALGGLVYALDGRHRRITIDHVRTAFEGEKTEEEIAAIARGAYRHFGATLFELLTLGQPAAESIERLVEMEGAERFERARARGKGVILTAAHFGNWELHAIAHGLRFEPVHLVAKEQDNALLNRWLEKVRGIFGNHVLYKQRALGQMRRLMKAGETVGLVIDQNVHLEDAVFVDFFGRKAATTPVPSWFALKTGAALVPVFCYPLPDGRYHAVYEEPVDVAPYRDLNRDEALLRITQELARIQEKYIRERPELWMWMHRRWTTRPPAKSVPPADPAPDREGASGGSRTTRALSGPGMSRRIRPPSRQPARSSRS